MGVAGDLSWDVLQTSFDGRPVISQLLLYIYIDVYKYSVYIKCLFMYRMNRKEKFQLRVESFLPLEYPRGFVDGPMDTVDEFSLF